jgi:hypothetical protein
VLLLHAFARGLLGFVILCLLQLRRWIWWSGCFLSFTAIGEPPSHGIGSLLRRSINATRSHDTIPEASFHRCGGSRLSKTFKIWIFFSAGRSALCYFTTKTIRSLSVQNGVLLSRRWYQQVLYRVLWSFLSEVTFLSCRWLR